jgi:hypothetical protein
MQIPPADLTPIRDLYAQGLYLQAHREAQRFGPLKDWDGAAAQVLGGRLAIQLGAPRLGRWLHLQAWRNFPTNYEAMYYQARYRLERFGPMQAWRFMLAHPDWSEAAPELRADWYGLHGFLAARLRDFDRAERWLRRADDLAPDRPWLCIERAAYLEFAERPDDALESGRRSLAVQEWFRPGIQTTAHLLCLLNRDPEALDLLVEGDRRLESSIVAAQLAALQTELRHYHDAARTYDRYAELCPLMETKIAEWLAARRSDTAYFLGDWATAITQAELVND